MGSVRRVEVAELRAAARLEGSLKPNLAPTHQEEICKMGRLAPESCEGTKV